MMKPDKLAIVPEVIMTAVLFQDQKWTQRNAPLFKSDVYNVIKVQKKKTICSFLNLFFVLMIF